MLKAFRCAVCNIELTEQTSTKVSVISDTLPELTVCRDILSCLTRVFRFLDGKRDIDAFHRFFVGLYMYHNTRIGFCAKEDCKDMIVYNQAYVSLEGGNKKYHHTCYMQILAETLIHAGV